MERESVKNGIEFMIMMFTMIWVSLIRAKVTLVQFWDDLVIILILVEEERGENLLQQVMFLPLCLSTNYESYIIF